MPTPPKRKPAPIRPRVLDEKAYERILRRWLDDVLFTPLEGRLQLATDVTQAYRAIQTQIATIEALPNMGIPVRDVEKQLLKVARYHRRRLIQTFRRALAVDIGPILAEPPIRSFMAQKLTENVALIKTIPPRAHDGLRTRIAAHFAQTPFDQAELAKLLQTEHGSQGYNLRRLTRDQTSKTISGLNQARQQELSIERYEWLTAQDERVRPKHVANSGQIFRWDDPPPDTGHPGDDVLCRCVAVAVMPLRVRQEIVDKATEAKRGPSSFIDWE